MKSLRAKMGISKFVEMRIFKPRRRRRRLKK